ncbi:hypothetical protein H3C61_01180 [Candidatus Gracilibacteria bacterium]|nr:hypothetical protein [Candidatus Gracilibacteria bacterium]
MSYKISAKNRKTKKFLLNIIYFLKFEWLNIKNSLKIIIIGVILSTIGLFLNWFLAVDGKFIGSGFHQIIGITGYILLLLNLSILFLIFSKKFKNSLKIFLNLQVKDDYIILFFILFGIIFSINTIFIIENISFFKEGIILGQGLPLTIVGYILSFFGVSLNIYSKTKTSIYIDDNFGDNISETENKNKSNMKLPF